MEKLFGQEVYGAILQNCSAEELCEVRLRLFQKIQIKTVSAVFFLDTVCTEEYLTKVLSTAVNGCFYAYEREIAQGYIDYEKGIRIGIVGRGTLSERQIGYKKIYALCIRIPRKKRSAVEKLGNFYTPFQNTLIIAPPYGGKTTLLRDMLAVLSERYDTLVLDERCELVGKDLVLGIGTRGDVLQGIEKEYVYQGIIRSMNPEIIVCDELFSQTDFEAIRRISEAGIRCLASYHAEEVQKVPESLREIFPSVITLSAHPTPGTILSYKRGSHAR